MARPRIHFEGETCEDCGLAPKRNKGGGRYGATCNPCHKAKWQRPYLKFRGTECEMCSYTPMFRSSLDVHHMDGDHTNDDPDNLQTLCATCHREMEGFLREVDGNQVKAEGLLAKFLAALYR